MTFNEVVVIASKAIAYVVKYEVMLAHKLDNQINEESILAAYDDAHNAVMWLSEAGQGVVLTGMMKAFEASSWLISPEEDYDAHESLMIEIYKKICMHQPADEVEEEVSPELEAQKADLEKMFSM